MVEVVLNQAVLGPVDAPIHESGARTCRRHTRQSVVACGFGGGRWRPRLRQAGRERWGTDKDDDGLGRQPGKLVRKLIGDWKDPGVVLDSRSGILLQSLAQALDLVEAERRVTLLIVPISVGHGQLLPSKQVQHALLYLLQGVVAQQPAQEREVMLTVEPERKRMGERRLLRRAPPSVDAQNDNVRRA